MAVFVALAVAATGNQADAQGMLVATFPASTPLDVQVDSSTGYVWVPDTAAAEVSVFEAQTNSTTPLAQVTVGDEPHHMSYDDSLDNAYVPDFGSGALSIINYAGGLFSVTGTVDLGAGSEPNSTTVDPLTHDVYVTEAGADAVAVVDPQTLQTVATVPVGAHPNGIAYDPDNGYVYVANQNGASVTVIDTSDNTVVATLTMPAGSTPHGVTVDPPLGEVFIADGNAGLLTTLSDSTDTVLWQAATGSGTHHVAYDLNQNVFTTDWMGDQVTALTSSGNLLANYRSCGHADGIAYDPANDDLYISCAGTNRVLVAADPYD